MGMSVTFMGVDVKTFFEFPGILITVGVILLFISIVLIVIAYKSMNTSNSEVDLSNDEDTIEDQNKREESDEEEAVPKTEIKQKDEIVDTTEEGFDLTKVFDVSGEDDNKEFSLDEVKFDSVETDDSKDIKIPEDTEDIKDIENTEDEEEIELL